MPPVPVENFQHGALPGAGVPAGILDGILEGTSLLPLEGTRSGERQWRKSPGWILS